MKSIVNHFLLILSLASLQVSADQVCKKDTISESTPTEQFTINTDGTVTDDKTGLMWMRCSLGQTWSGGGCTGTAVTYIWEDALTEAEAYNSGDNGYGSYSDWRLPNIKELTSIVEVACFDPSINEELFLGTGTISDYWSASSSYTLTNQALLVNFEYGTDSGLSKSQFRSVRLVRSGN